MTRKLTEWPFENGQTEKVGPSDGCRGNAVPLAAESKYDFRELETYLGNVGLIAVTLVDLKMVLSMRFPGILQRHVSHSSMAVRGKERRQQ